MNAVTYNRRWRGYRAQYLRQHPVCVMCRETGRINSASVVDHIIPHKGDYQLFWDKENHQSLCKPCHDRHKQRQEKSGVVVGCTADGIPLDAQHHWNKG